MTEERTITTRHGTIAYADSGPRDAPVVVLVHGLLVDGSLWRKVTPLLDGRFRCVVPELPLGSHRIPMAQDADLTPPGLAMIVADVLEALDLHDVTLVGNDTGGAICQLVVTRHPERVSRLVLTNCDAYDNFPPTMFKPLLLAARLPGGIAAIAKGMQNKRARQLPAAYGRLTKRPVPDEILDAWTGPAHRQPEGRRDVEKLLRGIDVRHTQEAAVQLRELTIPALVAWAPEDRFFPPAYAERLAADIPDARLEWVDDSLTFVPEDQPERLADLVASFVTTAMR